jgi:hypothetical protein
MCDPVSAAAGASLAITAASTVTTVIGQQRANEANKIQNEYEASVARNNAIIADRYAQDAIDRGKSDESAHRRQVRRFIGGQKTALAANGVDVGSESALDVFSDTAGTGELDAITIRRNAEREAMGFRTQGANFRASAEMARFRGGINPYSPFATALTGASQLAGKFGAYYESGVFGPKPPRITPAKIGPKSP